MKVTVFNGSPRGKASNTNIMVDLLLEGMRDAGAEVENILLAEKRIEQCRGCFSCFTKTPGRCCIEDDNKELLYKYVNSDLVGLATPLYCSNMTALLKNFIDRTLPLKSGLILEDGSGNFYHPGNIEYPGFFIVSNCGFPGKNNFWVLKAIFSPFSPMAEIYRNSGELLRICKEGPEPAGSSEHRPETILRVTEYKENLRKAGYEMILNGYISPDTLSELNKDLVDDETYREDGSSYLEFKK